jgi:murein DD-endopeptidase MepM/ murein hydrolase activator NlpD
MRMILNSARQLFFSVILLAPAIHAGAESYIEVSSTDVVISSPAVVSEPFLAPVGGTFKPKIVSGFGKRTLPAAVAAIAPKAPATEMHEGVDFSVPPGSPVRAAQAGKVLFAGFSTMYVTRADKKDKNRFVILLHPDGRSTRYVHLNTLHVTPGQQVAAGDILGSAAESDEWTGPVLHFEVRDAHGKVLDPRKVLLKEPKAL